MAAVVGWWTQIEAIEELSVETVAKTLVMNIKGRIRGSGRMWWVHRLRLVLQHSSRWLKEATEEKVDCGGWCLPDGGGRMVVVAKGSKKPNHLFGYVTT